MTIVLFRLRTELRAHWGTWLAVAIVVALGAGAVMAGIAGARRADSVAARLSQATHRADAVVESGYFYGKSKVDAHGMARLPQVSAVGRTDFLVIDGRTRSGAIVWPDESPDQLSVYEPVGPVEAQRLDRPVVISGRRPDPTHPDEVMLDPASARIMGYGVGDHFDLRFATKRFVQYIDLHHKDFRFDRSPGSYRSGPLVRLHVVGVGTSLESTGIWLSPAFYPAHDRGMLQTWVRADAFALHAGEADISGFNTGVERLAGNANFGFFDNRDSTIAAQDAVDLETRMVWAVAIVGALAMLVLTVTLLARQAAGGSRDWDVLRAVGMRRRQLVWLGATQGAVVGFVAAALAVAVAIGLSPVFPVGRAHTLEPSPGVAVDAEVIMVGALAIVLVCTIASGLVTWRIAARLRSIPRSQGADGVDRRLRRLPLTAAAGLSGVLDRGAARASTATTLVGATVAVAAVCAAIVVTASFGHLLANPPLYGQNWDLEVGEGGSTQPSEVPFLDSKPAVGAFAQGATAATLHIDGEQTGVQAMTRGSVTPTVSSGRAPRSAREILLAYQTMASLHAHIGSWVVVRRHRRSARMRVVGEGLLPPSSANGLGDGAAVTIGGLKLLVPKSFASLFRVRLAPGVSMATGLADLNQGGMVVFRSVPPEAVSDTARRSSLAYAIAAIAVVVAVVALAHSLVASVRDRRRDLAVLKTVGFVRSQLLMTVMWQAILVATVAVAIGIPLGVTIGSWLWTQIAGDMGVLRVTVQPTSLLLAVIPAALVIASVTAIVPGRSAAHTRAAQALRAE